MKLSSIFILIPIFISFFSVAEAEQISAGKFVFIRGDVTINRLLNNKMTQIKAQNNDIVYKSDMIETTSNATARVRLIDSNQIDIYPKTKVSISEYIYKPAENKKNVELNIEYGKIQSTVRQKYDGTKNTYRVKTPGIVAGVRGTIFTVTYESGLSSTLVTEGIVDVQINSAGGEKASESSGALVRPQQKIQFIKSQKKIEVTSFSQEDIEKIKSEREVFKEADAKSKSDSKIEADKELKPNESNKQLQKDSKSRSSSVLPDQKIETAVDSAVPKAEQEVDQNGQKIKDTADHNKGLIRSDRAEEALQNARGQQIKESVSKGAKGIEKSAAEVSAERRSEALQKKLKELNTLTKTTNAETKESIKQQAEEAERRKAEEAAAAAEAKRLAEEAQKKAEEEAAKKKSESAN